VAIHGKGESSRRGSYKALYEYYRAMWIFYKKHYAFKQPWYMTAMVYAGVCILCAVGIGLYPFKTDKRIGSRYS
jgi:GT2 family glycosyltransferase